MLEEVFICRWRYYAACRSVVKKHRSSASVIGSAPSPRRKAVNPERQPSVVECRRLPQPNAAGACNPSSVASVCDRAPAVPECGRRRPRINLELRICIRLCCRRPVQKERWFSHRFLVRAFWIQQSANASKVSLTQSSPVSSVAAAKCSESVVPHFGASRLGQRNGRQEALDDDLVYSSSRLRPIAKLV